MNKRTKDWLITNGIIVAIALIILFALRTYVNYVNGHECVYKKGEPPVSCSLTIVESKSWSEAGHGYVYGLQYDAVAKNLSDVNLCDWEATVIVPEHTSIDSYWNGEVAIKDGKITITPVEYNQIIEAGGNRAFGFILYSNTMDNVQDFEIHFYKLISITDLGAFWLLMAAIFVVIVVDIIFAVSEIKTRNLRAKKNEYQNITREVFTLFSKMIDARDPYTNGHSIRVAAYSRELARRMGLSKDEQDHVFLVAMLHDIGKVAIPDTVLLKSGKLTPEEFVQIEQHVKIGGEILKDSTSIEGLCDGASFHHERYDGTGYVTGLKGEDIPLVARIICVADAFDAMTSNRCYRPSQPLAVVIEELKKCSGTQFDPKIVPYMLDMIEEKIAPIDLEKTPVDFYTGKE